MIDLPQTLLHRAAIAFDSGDIMTADSLCSRLVAAHADHALAWILLGRIRTRQSKFAEAEAAIERARVLKPTDAEVPHALALVRMRQGRFAEALSLLEKSQSMDPTTDRTVASRAKCLVRLGQPREALKLLGKPATADAALAAGEAANAVGEFDLAETHLRRTLEFRGNTAATQQARQLLAELLDRRGDYPGAFQEMTAAKPAAAVKFDPQLAAQAIDKVIETFDAGFFAQAPKPTHLTRRPVFIVGMPRSGTTLLEKMIASHPAGAGAGETDALTRQVRTWADPQNPEKSWPRVVRSLTAADLDSIVKTYLSATEVYAGHPVTRVADKHLQNWYHLGLIAVAFPEAAIIHITRDPMDTGLSCYERLLPNAMPWSVDLRSVGVTLALCEDLMGHWHKMFGARLHSVRYEDLVREPAKFMPPILAAIGLPWDEACIQPHLRKPRHGSHEPPPTLSVEQVKRPLYDSSIGRAERYGTLLDPMRQAYKETRTRTRS